jgi:hypothetical protein
MQPLSQAPECPSHFPTATPVSLPAIAVVVVVAVIVIIVVADPPCGTIAIANAIVIAAPG